MSDYDNLKKTFFTEGHEILEGLDVLLLDLENDPSNIELLNSIFRSMHTLKGSCGIFGFHALERFAHLQEDLLDCLRTEQLSPTPDIIDILFDSVDRTKVIFEMLRDDEEIEKGFTYDMEEKIKIFLPRENVVNSTKKTPGNKGIDQEFMTDICDPSKAKVKQAVDEGKRVYQITIELKESCMQEGIDPLLLIKRLRHDGEVIITRSSRQIPALTELDPSILYFTNIKLIYSSKMGINEISDIFEFALEAGDIYLHQFTPAELKDKFDIDADPFWIEAGSSTREESEESTQKADKMSLRGKVDSKAGSAIKIEPERLDNLVDLVGELVIAQTLVAQDERLKELSDGRLEKNIAQLTKITKNIQEHVMSMRMLPLSHTFQKMSRLVRDVAKKAGKEVAFNISGEETEVDKTVIDEIGDPLIHILRNAVDHGIERAEDRTSIGKPRKGMIELNAFHQGGNVVIEVRDDGKGLNREGIIKRGKDKGLITEEADLTDSQVCNLIFEAGFSTSETITEISGRGVGLDVVRKSMEKLRGTIDVKTAPGSGTIFTIKLPLTLAIIDGMIVNVGEERYIVPTLSVESSLRPGRDDMTVVAGRGEMVNVRGSLLPLVRLHNHFNVETEKIDPCDAILIIIENDGKKCCLMVDNIIGHQQAVIKSLGERFKELQGISGCTILGDGKVGLILDAGGIIRQALE